MGRGDQIRWRWRLMVALVVLVLSACSPEEPVARLVNVEVSETGEIAILGSEQYPEGASNSEVDWQVDTQVCLAESPLDCVRIELGTGRIDESADGGKSWRRVLDIDDSEPWLARVVAYSFADPDVEAFDVAVAPDDRVLVAMGRLGIVERNADGEWSTSDADLRRLPKKLVAAAAVVVSTLMLAIRWHRLRATFAYTGLVAVILALPALMFVFVGASSSNGDLVGAIGGVFIGFPLWVVSVAITLVTAVRAFREDRRSFWLVAQMSTVDAAAFALALTGIYALWSGAVVGWHTSIVMCAVITIGALAAASRPCKRAITAPTAGAVDSSRLTPGP
ncbi:MAG: hypothetical protein R8J94_21180 [Acidimicrobiia bacterium]|nr:hypothetical protein [Acidimicrobiia bacterium]